MIVERVSAAVVELEDMEPSFFCGPSSSATDFTNQREGSGYHRWRRQTLGVVEKVEPTSN